MIIDCRIENTNSSIILTDLTFKPKVKIINIQIITPKGNIINTFYKFKKMNIFGEKILGKLEYGVYTFKINNIDKLVFFKDNFPLRKMYIPCKNFNI